tara:strand:+ start:340 stop:549 length:210 start_codon:yes stop_codon:yes gene_type:complete
MNEVLVVHYNESALSTLLLGPAKINTERLTEFLNGYTSQGYSIKAVEREFRRMLLLFKREVIHYFSGEA